MNKKNINAVLSKVHKEFYESITDPLVREAVKNNSIITGGALVSLLTGQEVNDYDYYFTDFDTCLMVTDYYVTLINKKHGGIATVKTDECNRIKIFIKSHGVAGDDETEPNLPSYTDPQPVLIEEDELFQFADEDEEDEDNIIFQTNITPDSDLKNIDPNPKFQPVFLSSNAITLRGKIQLVIRFYGNAQEIHDNYDFVHCMNYWTSKDKKVVLNPLALEAIINKELIYTGSRYPLCSIIRTRKFIARGYTINAGQYLKMCMQLNDLNLKNIGVLEDQLVGVDSAYFNMLIEKLRKQDENIDITTDYVISVIDKIF